jgi:transcriptional regulator with XRE-family HTH domain
MSDEARLRELADFLRTRRQRTSPADLGLQPGRARRTPGLRREEVANAAGVSASLYMWLEQARDIRVSERVLNGISRALRLDAPEKAQLYELALRRPPSVPIPTRQAVSQTVRDLLSTLGGTPAIAFNLRWDTLAWNDAARAFFFDYELAEGLERNILWYTFQNPRIRSLFVDWETCARDVVARFRADYSRHAGEADFETLINTLCDVSEKFSYWWRLHNVLPTPGENTVQFDHPAAGRLALRVVHLALPGEPGLKVVLFLPRRDGFSELRLADILASWELDNSSTPWPRFSTVGGPVRPPVGAGTSRSGAHAAPASPS